MPRFGHAGLLDEMQLKHLMALLLDPKSLSPIGPARKPPRAGSPEYHSLLNQ